MKPESEKVNICQHCNKKGAERYRQNTQYVDEERNWVTLCPECRQKNDDYWKDMWADYYSNIFLDKDTNERK